LNRWNRAQAALLKSWISWWSGIKLAERRYPVIIVGRFCYLPAGVWPFGIASRSVRMLRELSRLHRDVGEDVSLTILPQLGNITLEDVNEWISEHESLADYDAHDLRPRIRKFFSGRTRMRLKRVPMSEAALFLRRLLGELDIKVEEPTVWGTP